IRLIHILNKPVIIAIIVSLLVSCEDIIDIPLNDSEPRLVIEGVVTNLEGPYTVRISKSVDYYEPGVYPVVNDAHVELGDGTGFIEVLEGNEEGLYSSSKMAGHPGRTYSLKVELDGKSYMAESQLKIPVKIDSLKKEYFPAFGDLESGYYIHCHFTDPSEEGNNYRLIAWKNGEMDENLYIMDDKFINGQTVDYFFYFTSYQIGDSVKIALASIDRPVYEYYTTLFNIVAQQGGGNPANPANPISNLSNGALGYFGALAIDQQGSVVK
ncbi:MAG: DUF4249 domain-containing protein, partial [Bacteroidales bacterium]|nr:DUF4249 domain-containing protein [Bacteroidales bacterium]